MKWGEMKSEAKRIYWETLHEATVRMGGEIEENKAIEVMVKKEEMDRPMPSNPDEVMAREKKKRLGEVIQISSSDSEGGAPGWHEKAQRVVKEESVAPQCDVLKKRRKKKRTTRNEEDRGNVEKKLFESIAEEAKTKKSLEEIIGEEEGIGNQNGSNRLEGPQETEKEADTDHDESGKSVDEEQPLLVMDSKETHITGVSYGASMGEEERAQLWISLSRGVMDALRHQIPQYHSEWILKGGRVDVEKLNLLGVRLSLGDLWGLSEGGGGR